MAAAVALPAAPSLCTHPRTWHHPGAGTPTLGGCWHPTGPSSPPAQLRYRSWNGSTQPTPVPKDPWLLYPLPPAGGQWQPHGGCPQPHSGCPPPRQDPQSRSLVQLEVEGEGRAEGAHHEAHLRQVQPLQESWSRQLPRTSPRKKIKN